MRGAAIVTVLRRVVSRRGGLVLAGIMVAGFVVRLPFVYADVGAGNDVETFMRWARTAQANGLTRIYDAADVDYGPSSVYLLAGAGYVDAHLPDALRAGDGALITLIKLPSILADVLTAGLLAWTIKARARSVTLPIFACCLYLFNPAIWYVSAYWGQTDSVYTLFLVATVVALARGAVVPAWLSYALVLTFKIVAVSVAPLLIAWTLVKHGWRATAIGFSVFLAAWAVIFSPWLVAGRIGEVIHHAYVDLPTEPPRVDVSAYNLWYLLLGGHVHAESSHSHVSFLPVTYQTAGNAMFAAFVAVVVIAVLRRGSGVVVAAAMLHLGMFMLLTQMHERFLLPVLPLVLLWACEQSARARDPGQRRPGLWWEYGVLSLTFLFNLVTIASFVPSLLTNLIAAEADSPRVVFFKAVALAVAAINLAVLAALVRRTVLGRGTEIHEQYA